MKTITIKVASTREDLEERGPDLVDASCDTMRAARTRARHFLSDTYARAAEMSEPFGFAQVEVNGIVEEEFER